jgi:cell division control protein 7
VPTLDTAPPSLLSVILKLNPFIYTPHSPNPTSEEAKAHIEDVDQSIDLCTRLLRLDSTRRLTAKVALRHPFLSKGMEGLSGDVDEGETELLKGTEGKCGKLHGETAEGRRESTRVTSGDAALTVADYAFFGRDCPEMQFGQGLPPTRADCELSTCAAPW